MQNMDSIDRIVVTSYMEFRPLFRKILPMITAPQIAVWKYNTKSY